MTSKKAINIKSDVEYYDGFYDDARITRELKRYQKSALIVSAGEWSGLAKLIIGIIFTVIAWTITLSLGPQFDSTVFWILTVTASDILTFITVPSIIMLFTSIPGIVHQRTVLQEVQKLRKARSDKTGV